MKKDITSKKDIRLLVDSFYDRVRPDPLIGHFFSTVVAVDWNKHLPVMYAFWENVLFHKGTYSGNPMVQHQALHQKCPMKPEHFQRWLQLFSATVNDLFEGDNAEVIKQRATSIATVMQIKIIH